LWSPCLDADPADLAGLKTRGEARQSERDKQGIDAVLKALIEQPATSRQLRERTGFGKDRLGRLMDKLVSAEKITTKTVTIKGNECKEYHLPEPEF